MTPQELKNSILQLAIQGKLVEQRAEEGTAAEKKAAEKKKKAEAWGRWRLSLFHRVCGVWASASDGHRRGWLLQGCVLAADQGR